MCLPAKNAALSRSARAQACWFIENACKVTATNLEPTQHRAATFQTRSSHLAGRLRERAPVRRRFSSSAWVAEWMPVR